MKAAIQQLVDDHLTVASQYEAVGDATGAAKCRAVANMVASLLRNERAGTILPPITDANREEIKQKAHTFDEAVELFCHNHHYPSDDWQDELAYEEGARRALSIAVYRPADARVLPFLSGLRDGASVVWAKEAASQALNIRG